MIVAHRACMEHSNASSSTCVKYSSASLCSKARSASHQRHCCSCCTDYLLLRVKQQIDLFGISNCNCNCNFNSQRILETNFINIFDPTFVQTIKSNPQSEDSKMILSRQNQYIIGTTSNSGKNLKLKYFDKAMKRRKGLGKPSVNWHLEQ